MIEEEGLALRGTFVNNPEGQIKIVETHDLGIGRSAKELIHTPAPTTSFASAAQSFCNPCY